MAESKGIRRFLELVLDKAKAQKTQREAQDAINKGTDPRGAQGNLSKIDRAFGGLGKAALKLGGVLAGVFALGRIKDFGVAAVKEFAAAEAVWAKLGATLETVGIRLEDVQDQIDGVAVAMRKTSTLGDEDVASALQTLVQLSGDYAGSLEKVQVVADLAVGANMSLESAAELVGKAMAGNTTLLERQFPLLKGNKDALAAIATLMAGQAAGAAGTLGGQVKILSNSWNEFKEAVGEAITNVGNGSSVIDVLTGSVQGLTTWIKDNQQVVDTFAASLQTIVLFLGDALSRLPRVLNNLERIDKAADLLTPMGMGSAIMRRIFGVEGDAGPTPLEKEGTQFELDRMGSGGGAAAPPRLPPIIPPRPSAEDLKAAEDHVKKLWEHLGQFIASNQQLAGGIPLAGVLDRFAGLSEAGKQKMEEDAARLRDFAAKGGTLGMVTPHGAGAPETDVAGLERQIELMERLGNVAETVSASITDGFQRAFDQIGLREREQADITAQYKEKLANATTENQKQQLREWYNAEMKATEEIAGFYEMLGRSIASSMLAALAEYAKGKAAENFAEAIEASAAALGFGASGNIASAALSTAEIAQRFAAGAAWSALAGAAASGGSRVSGGGGGHGLSSNRDAGASIAQRAERVGAEINIYLSGEFDMLNPQLQRALYGTMQQAKETFGENSKITVKPSPGR